MEISHANRPTAQQVN